MKMLISKNKFEKAKCRDNIPFLCKNCKQIFYRNKNQVLAAIRFLRGRTADFCSRQCAGKFYSKSFDSNCSYCNKKITKTMAEHRKSKSKRFFCSRNCSSSYNNLHKTKGTRCSKLELWMQTKLKQKYKKVHFCFNEKGEIGSELDIYIPSMKLAFELNGIYHYEPIHGVNKLIKIQSNDNRKFQACLEHLIELCIIDCSSLKYFKEQNAQKYMDIICSIIERKMVLLSGNDPAFSG